VRTYGRITNADGSKSWVKVETDDQGYDDLVWVVTLAQALLLNLNESPFYADYGIPGKNAVIQQIAPDFYVARAQQRFAQHFASLVVAREYANPPTYRINVTTNQGFKLNTSIPVPQ
jgi:hypothetical protein